jgi:hypothetical protein
MVGRVPIDGNIVRWDFGTVEEVKAVITADDDPGETGQILTSAGAGEQPTWEDPASGGGGAVDFQRFNSSGTWNKPTDESFGPNSIVEIYAVGAGGGGETASGSSGKGGGGGGSSKRRMLLSELGSTETVTIGGGGAPETNGGDTTFGSHLTGYGGGGATTKGGSGDAGGPLGQLAQPRIISLSTIYLGAGGTTVNPPGDGIDHGGGGAGSQDSNPEFLNGGDSVWGGGGGGGGDVDQAGTGGISINAGNGGDGGFNAAVGENGVQPGGGGGTSETTTAGSGADGRVDVIVYPVAPAP